MTDLARAYSDAVYQVRLNDRPVAFTFADEPAGSGVAPPLPGAEWAIITACNPGRSTLSDNDNRDRNEELGRTLRAHGWEHSPSVASDRMGGHREPGFLVVGITMDDAIATARAFEQLAVVFGHDARCGLLFADPPRWLEQPAVACDPPPGPPLA